MQLLKQVTMQQANKVRSGYLLKLYMEYIKCLLEIANWGFRLFDAEYSVEVLADTVWKLGMLLDILMEFVGRHSTDFDLEWKWFRNPVGTFRNCMRPPIDASANNKENKGLWAWLAPAYEKGKGGAWSGLKMATSSSLAILPADPLLHIFSYLDYYDIISCSQVCRRFDELCAYDSLWKRLCFHYWPMERYPQDLSWKEIFQEHIHNFGRYVHIYKKIKQAWMKLRRYLEENCPDIANTFDDGGTTEDKLDAIEYRLKCKLPEDMRCSYRIVNGQTLRSPGLFGSMQISSHYRSECLLSIERSSNTRVRLNHCLPLTLCADTGLTQYIALGNNRGHIAGQIFYPTANGPNFDYFISGKSFTSWFTEQVDLLANNEYPLINGEPYRFYHNKESIAKTGPITVSVATCFLPELSTVEPPHFFHTYRITMSMNEDAPESSSCQLETRHWIITDENDHEETVDGPGVVGEFPIMRPGKSFSWISCTSYMTTYGHMKGHFVMQNLSKGEYPILRQGSCYSYISCTAFRTPVGNMRGTYTFLNLKSGTRLEVQCPTFHMKCLLYVTHSREEED